MAEGMYDDGGCLVQQYFKQSTGLPLQRGCFSYYDIAHVDFDDVSEGFP